MDAEVYGDLVIWRDFFSFLYETKFMIFNLFSLNFYKILIHFMFFFSRRANFRIESNVLSIHICLRFIMKQGDLMFLLLIWLIVIGFWIIFLLFWTVSHTHTHMMAVWKSNSSYMTLHMSTFAQINLFLIRQHFYGLT